MNRTNLKNLWTLYAIPALLSICGLILLIWPDSATALVATLLGWTLVICGAAKAITMVTKHTESVSGWIWAAAGVILGVGILRNPLVLAESLGRIIGLMLAIWAIGNLRHSTSRGGRIIAIITLFAGVGLFLTPLSLTRTLVRLCGIILAAVGIVNIAEKIRENRLPENTRPDIIDADE